jgi:hypothetical protein
LSIKDPKLETIETEGELGFEKEKLLENNENENNESRDSISSAASTRTFNLENDDEYQARKGLRGIFGRIFKKK